MRKSTTIPAAGTTLTQRQQQVVTFYRRYLEANETNPTLEEVAVALGVTKVTALEHIITLVQKGVMFRGESNIRKYGLSEKCPTCGKDWNQVVNRE